MRTLIISYDLAQPHRNKHVLAQLIMALGSSWARPLEQTWYVRTEATEDMIEHQLAGQFDPDDGLLIQAVKDDAVLTNTALRWFRQRRAGIEIGVTPTSSPSPSCHPSPPTSRPSFRSPRPADDTPVNPRQCVRGVGPSRSGPAAVSGGWPIGDARAATSGSWR